MGATFWIEKVQAELTIVPSSEKAQTFFPAGPHGPSFFAPPNPARQSAVVKTVTWTQVQYSQMVLLNFNGLSWPHASVATLVEQGNFVMFDV